MSVAFIVLSDKLRSVAHTLLGTEVMLVWSQSLEFIILTSTMISTDQNDKLLDEYFKVILQNEVLSVQ